MSTEIEDSNKIGGGTFHHVVTLFSYVYLLRIPLIAAAILLALPPLALWSRLSSLLENLFVLDTWGIFWAMMIELTLAWSLLVVCRIVLLNGKDRFGIDQWKKEDTLTGGSLFLASLPTLSLLICAWVEKDKELATIPLWRWLLAASVGSLIAYCAGFVGLVISLTLAPQYKTHPAGQRFKTLFPFSARILGGAEKLRLVNLKNPNRFADMARKYLPVDLRSGYLDQDCHVYPGHWLVFMLLIISSILYLVLGVFRGPRLGERSILPALSYVLIFMVVATFILSMLAFFLDRYRVPLILPIAIMCTIGGCFPKSDHYFRIRDKVSIEPVSPWDTLGARSRLNINKQNPNGRVIVVATAGGGIQAAGWTVEVLTKLQTVCQVSGEKGLNFGNSIAAVSAVSGGAVGTMFYVNKYDTTGAEKGFHATNAEMKTILDEAEGPTLTDVAWAMVYIDPYRIFFPYLIKSDDETLDRGYVLEQTWRIQGSVYDYLSKWREGVSQGYRPAVIFNSTIAETGQPFLFATTDFDVGTGQPARETFNHLFPNSDLPVVTAARLAASFPFVSPASRPLTKEPQNHIVDGGYYDNFGVDSLAAWLDQALTGLPQGKRPNILFIQIRSFPYNTLPAPSQKDWFYQTYAPINALVSVRTTAQLVRDSNELELLAAKWAALDNVHITPADFDFQEEGAPLSWMMTSKQEGKIVDYWNSPHPDKGFDVDKVRSFCSFGLPPVSEAAEAH